MITRLYACGTAVMGLRFFHDAINTNPITKTLANLAILANLIRDNFDGDINTAMRAIEGAVAGIATHSLLTYLMTSAGFTTADAVKINSIAIAITTYAYAKASEYNQPHPIDPAVVRLPHPGRR